jgi:hypothetical protein
LRYDAFYQERQVKLAQRIEHTLKQVGLQTEWSGQADGRITIVNFVWRKRRSTFGSAYDEE